MEPPGWVKAPSVGSSVDSDRLPSGLRVSTWPVFGSRVWLEPSGNVVVSVPSSLSVVVDPSGFSRLVPGLSCEVDVTPSGEVLVTRPVRGSMVCVEPSGNFVVSVPSSLSWVLPPVGEFSSEEPPFLSGLFRPSFRPLFSSEVIGGTSADGFGPPSGEFGSPFGPRPSPRPLFSPSLSVLKLLLRPSPRLLTPSPRPFRLSLRSSPSPLRLSLSPSLRSLNPSPRPLRLSLSPSLRSLNPSPRPFSPSLRPSLRSLNPSPRLLRLSFSPSLRSLRPSPIVLMLSLSPSR